LYQLIRVKSYNAGDLECSGGLAKFPNTSIGVGMGTEERRSVGDADDPGECEDLEWKLFNLA
jgi:hypothetical protein